MEADIMKTKHIWFGFIALLLLLVGTMFVHAESADCVPDGYGGYYYEHVHYSSLGEKDKPTTSLVADSFYDLSKEVTTIPIHNMVNGIPVKGTSRSESSGEWRKPVSRKDRAPFVKHLVIEDGIRTIGGASFASMQSLQTVVLPASLQAIRFSAFQDCPSLKTVRFEDGLKSIDNFAFYQCKKLENISLPATLQAIGRKTFARTGLKTITITQACTSLGAGAFAHCNRLKSVFFSEKQNGKMVLDDYVFGRDAKLQRISFPRNTEVSLIGSPFLGCSGLESITWPKKTTRLYKDALLGCTGLKKLRVLSTSADFLSTDAQFLQTLPDTCRVYVKTEAMKQAFLDAGCKNRVIVKADLK
jgi:hypothetical protein